MSQILAPGQTDPHKAKLVQTKLMKGLLDLIILKFLTAKPMHGYQVMSKIRKNFSVYFGPSTIYPLLGVLEGKGYIKSEWIILKGDRPKKVYKITAAGETLLKYTEDSLNFIFRKIGGTEPRTPVIEARVNVRE